MKKLIIKIWGVFEEHMTPIIVFFSVFMILSFVCVDIFLQMNNIIISDTLIDNFFKFFGFEMLALSGIKISKHIGSAFGKTMDAIDGIYVDETETENENE